MTTVSKILASALLSTVAGLGFSQPAPAAGTVPREEKILKSLGLADDQVVQVTAL